jgi:hypothetical protein
MRILKMDGAELLAALIGAFLAFITTVIGLFAIPFVGAGPEGAFRVLSISLGIEFPIYVIFLFISRRVLMCGCWVMCVISYAANCMVLISEKWFPVDFIGILKTLGIAILLPDDLLCVVVALLTTYMYRTERWPLVTD